MQLWLSDKQAAFVKGIAAEFAGVPHRYCANHFLRDLAKPMLEADSHAKVRMRSKVRGLRVIEREVLQQRHVAAAAVAAVLPAVGAAAVPPAVGAAAVLPAVEAAAVLPAVGAAAVPPAVEAAAVPPAVEERLCRQPRAAAVPPAVGAAAVLPAVGAAAVPPAIGAAAVPPAVEVASVPPAVEAAAVLPAVGAAAVPPAVEAAAVLPVVGAAAVPPAVGAAAMPPAVGVAAVLPAVGAAAVLPAVGAAAVPPAVEVAAVSPAVGAAAVLPVVEAAVVPPAVEVASVPPAVEAAAVLPAVGAAAVPPAVGAAAVPPAVGAAAVLPVADVVTGAILANTAASEGLSVAEPAEPGDVVLDYCSVVRGILNDDQGGPLQPSGLRMAEALKEVRASLQHNLDTNRGGRSHAQLQRLAGCIDRGLTEVEAEQEEVRAQLQEVQRVASTLDVAKASTTERQRSSGICRRSSPARRHLFTVIWRRSWRALRRVCSRAVTRWQLYRTTWIWNAGSASPKGTSAASTATGMRGAHCPGKAPR